MSSTPPFKALTLGRAACTFRWRRKLYRHRSAAGARAGHGWQGSELLDNDGDLDAFFLRRLWRSADGYLWNMRLG